MAELNVAYHHSPLSMHQGHFKGLKAGDYIPFFKLLDANTQNEQSSLEILQGIKHQLLILIPKGKSVDDAILNTIRDTERRFKDLIVIQIISPEPLNLPIPVKVWLDPKGQQIKKWGIKSPSILLIRPDKYIGLLQAPLNPEALLTYLQTYSN